MDMNSALEGISSSTIQNITLNNVDKKMTKQASETFKMYSDIAGKVGEDFNQSFKRALVDGLKPEELRRYFGTLLLSPISMDEIRFKMRVIIETKMYEERMKLRMQEQLLQEQQPELQVINGGMQKTYANQNDEAA